MGDATWTSGMTLNECSLKSWLKVKQTADHLLSPTIPEVRRGMIIYFAVPSIVLSALETHAAELQYFLKLWLFSSNPVWNDGDYRNRKTPSFLTIIKGIFQRTTMRNAVCSLEIRQFLRDALTDHLCGQVRK
ncbi:hypothetical protein M514_06112 [Trichuris suis]|uniref:Uncharacterized protein n=1 Tax=Trichuris suis TaxID=68888 RepID=A0A085NK77_9BILA|nr:hypothetical protein M513_06112 [Trichuris suis]KFD69873.1 hypothetical protein M514_06112 [Trichuris suis]